MMISTRRVSNGTVEEADEGLTEDTLASAWPLTTFALVA